MGRHPLQLYSLATPNGVKVTVMLEELLALGHVGDGLCVIGKVALPDPLHLQIQEEALHHSVIPTIALSAHAAHQAMRLQQRLAPAAWCAALAYCVNSISCRSISTKEVLYGKSKGLDARANQPFS